MKKKEFKEFVKSVIDRDPDKPDQFAREIDEIVAQWESDVDEACEAGREAGWDAGQNSMYDAGYIMPNDY